MAVLMRTARALCGAVAVAIALAAAPAAFAQSPPASEYEVKAAFLFNFARFVEWPAAGSGPVPICVVGTDPFGRVLDETIGAKQVNGRAIQIRRLQDVGAVADCQLVFVGGDRGLADRLVATVRQRAILTVGEAKGFAERGGIIELVVQQAKVGLRVNPKAAARAGLKISSQLMKLAEVVEGD